MRLVLFLNFKNDLTDEPSTKHHRERGGIATNGQEFIQLRIN
jgi:hypothetical protein